MAEKYLEFKVDHLKIEEMSVMALLSNGEFTIFQGEYHGTNICGMI